jgi:predicted Rdx family selenoprotein
MYITKAKGTGTCNHCNKLIARNELQLVVFPYHSSCRYHITCIEELIWETKKELGLVSVKDLNLKNL